MARGAQQSSFGKQNTGGKVEIKTVARLDRNWKLK